MSVAATSSVVDKCSCRRRHRRRQIAQCDCCRAPPLRRRILSRDSGGGRRRAIHAATASYLHRARVPQLSYELLPGDLDKRIRAQQHLQLMQIHEVAQAARARRFLLCVPPIFCRFPVQRAALPRSLHRRLAIRRRSTRSPTQVHSQLQQPQPSTHNQSQQPQQPQQQQQPTATTAAAATTTTASATINNSRSIHNLNNRNFHRMISSINNNRPASLAPGPLVRR
jgi:hypothetical protein